MGILGKTGGLRLLGSEEALLRLGDLEKPPFRFTMTSWHNTILQLKGYFMQVGAGGKDILPKPHSRQGYAPRCPSGETTESWWAGANEPNLGNFMVSKRQGYGLSHTPLFWTPKTIDNIGRWAFR
jgi:hypothetical protein